MDRTQNRERYTSFVDYPATAKALLSISSISIGILFSINRRSFLEKKKDKGPRISTSKVTCVLPLICLIDW